MIPAPGCRFPVGLKVYSLRIWTLQRCTGIRCTCIQVDVLSGGVVLRVKYEFRGRTWDPSSGNHPRQGATGRAAVPYDDYPLEQISYSLNS